MNKQVRWIGWVIAFLVGVTPSAKAAVVAEQGTWSATLQGRDLDGNLANGFEAYYDLDLNISWLTNASEFVGTWDLAQKWAENLNVFGVGGWRLPKMVDTGSVGCNFAYSGTDCGYNVNTGGSELAHLIQGSLGVIGPYAANGGINQDWTGISNDGPFKSLSGGVYWFGNEYFPDTSSAWVFLPYKAYQDRIAKNTGAYAWAVHDGDVGAVPEPASAVLTLFGAALVALAARRQR